MSTLRQPTFPPRSSTKRAHVSPSAATLPEDPISKRQKTVRTHHQSSTGSSSLPGAGIDAGTVVANGRFPSAYNTSSSPIVSSDLSSQPEPRNIPPPALPADFFVNSPSSSTILPVSGRERALPPPPPAPVVETDAEVDEAEWAAFEADIALTKQEASTTTTITNPPPSAVIYAAPTGPGAPTISPGLDQKAALVEDEAKLDREDAQNKLAEEFEEMESLESRVQRLKEQREALRVKALGAGGNRMEVTLNNEDEEDEEDDYEDEDWIHFSR